MAALQRRIAQVWLAPPALLPAPPARSSLLDAPYTPRNATWIQPGWGGACAPRG